MNASKTALRSHAQRNTRLSRSRQDWKMSGNVARKQSTLEKFGQYELERRSEDLEGSRPEEILYWASRRFSSKLTFATGFGPEGCAIIDMIARYNLNIDIFTLDTGLFFPETYELWAKLEKHTGLRIRSVSPSVSLEQQAALYEDELWKTDPDACCNLRLLAESFIFL